MLNSGFEWTFLQLLHFFGLKVFISIICGGLVGFERELKNKSAGIKTNILICLGAALYTSVSLLISEIHQAGGNSGDPGRIAAQIVSGIGFLGGGAIIQSRGNVIGLTTAATIWVVAAIGVCIGIGQFEIAICCSLIVVLLLVTTTLFENRVLGRSSPFICKIVAEDPAGQVRLAIHQALAHHDLILDHFHMITRGKNSIMILHYKGHQDDHKKFILNLWNIPGIREINPS